MHVTRILLIRHGHTASNGPTRQPVMSGWADLSLSETGHRQVAVLGAIDAAASLDVIYSSPLRRAVVTAEALAGKRVPLRCLDGLREVGCGIVDGLPLDVVQRSFASEWARNSAEIEDDFRWPGGESYAELRRRAVETLSRIARDHRDARVAAVTHAGVITQVIGHLRGVAPRHWSRFRVGNASITELDWSGTSGAIVRLDDRGHLPEQIRT